MDPIRPAKVGAAVLAAGRSSRMGRPKALLPYRGRPFLAHVVLSLLEAGIAPVAVVLAPEARELAKAIPGDPRVETLENPEPEPAGPIGSLRCAVRALAGRTDSLFSCLVDHPAVAAATYRLLAEAFARKRPAILVPVHRGRRGHPALFSATIYEEILCCADEGGARNVIARDPARVMALAVDDPGVLLDVDTPEDFSRLGD
ncbi:MAG: nucleotidyltransferase family protein [Planctomycetes bacterium]|nr:nucleotidyltransferase family protein [Planctomycetota bacterium]